MTAQATGTPQRFELRHWPWVKKWVVWVVAVCIGFEVMMLFVDSWNWSRIRSLAIFTVLVLYYFWTKHQPPKHLEITDDFVRGPVGYNGFVEIPRQQLVAVSVSADGLNITWNRNGVPWLTEVPESWFSAQVWPQVRTALLAWGQAEKQDEYR